jgi:hypothetical protein
MDNSNMLLIEDEDDKSPNYIHVGSIGGMNNHGSVGNEYFSNSRFHSKEFRSVHGGGINQSTVLGDSTIIMVSIYLYKEYYIEKLN